MTNNQCDPALRVALKRKGYDSGGLVEDDNDNAGTPIATRASASADSLQDLTSAPSAAGSSPGSVGGGGGTSMPGQSQFGKMPSAEVPNFPKINLVSNAYSPTMRALPTPQSRQQAAAAALQPFINALAKLGVQAQSK